MGTLSGLSRPAQSYLKNPDAVTGVFDRNSLTLWVADEMVKSVLSKPAAVKKLEAAAAAFTGSPSSAINTFPSLVKYLSATSDAGGLSEILEVDDE